MATNPYNAYGQAYPSIPQGGNPRMTEAWALTEAARRMKDAQREPFDAGALLEAVRLNWRLWTIFQAELTSPECQVPEAVRNNMLSLSNFVDKRSVDIIGDPQPAKVNILISINREIAAGLFSVPKEAAAPAEAASSEEQQAAAALQLNTSV